MTVGAAAKRAGTSCLPLHSTVMANVKRVRTAPTIGAAKSLEAIVSGIKNIRIDCANGERDLCAAIGGLSIENEVVTLGRKGFDELIGLLHEFPRQRINKVPGTALYWLKKVLDNHRELRADPKAWASALRVASWIIESCHLPPYVFVDSLVQQVCKALQPNMEESVRIQAIWMLDCAMKRSSDEPLRFLCKVLRDRREWDTSFLCYTLNLLRNEILTPTQWVRASDALLKVLRKHRGVNVRIAGHLIHYYSPANKEKGHYTKKEKVTEWVRAVAEAVQGRLDEPALVQAVAKAVANLCEKHPEAAGVAVPLFDSALDVDCPSSALVRQLVGLAAKGHLKNVSNVLRMVAELELLGDIDEQYQSQIAAL